MGKFWCANLTTHYLALQTAGLGSVSLFQQYPFLTFSLSFHSPKREEAQSPNARLKTFPQTAQGIPQMKLLGWQLSFPGPCWLKNGSAELHSSARKTTGPGKRVCFSPGWDSPSTFFFFVVFLFSTWIWCYSVVLANTKIVQIILSLLFSASTSQNVPLLWPRGTTGNKREIKGRCLLVLQQVPIVKGTLYYAKAATDWLIPHVASFDTADAVLTMSSPLKLALPEPRSLRASNLPMYSIPTRPPAVTVPCVLQMRDVSIKIRGVPTGVSNSLDVTFSQNWGKDCFTLQK